MKKGNRKHTEIMTKVFQAVAKGKNDEALQMIKNAGIPEAEIELELVVRFVNFMKSG
jgi:hypothetical protein